MIVAEVPRFGRVCVFGTCRVINPVRDAAAARGGKLLLHKPHAFTQTAQEAEQQLHVARGELRVPAPLAPLVLGLTEQVPFHRDIKALIASADVFVIEISMLKDLRCAGFRFSINFLSEQFTRGGGPGMLAWYRVVSERPVAAAIVEDAAAALRAAGREVTDWHWRVLRETVSAPMSRADLISAVKSLTDKLARPCLLVPVFAIADAAQAYVRDRAVLAALVRETAAELGHGYFDPSATISRVGRSTALAGEGADVYHYAPAFTPMIGGEILDAAFAHAGPRRRWPWPFARRRARS